MIRSRNYLMTLKNALIGFMLAAGGYLLMMALWWSFGPYPTADVFEPIEVTNENNIVQPGETLNILIRFNKETDISPVVTRSLICNENESYFITVDDRSSSRPKGKFVGVAMFNLPESIPNNSTCVFEFSNVYQVNPIRTIVKNWESEPFTVLKE